MTSSLRRLRISDGALSRAEREEVGAALAAGAVVALPTETVYGLAARADRPEAVRRLRELKGRDPRLPLTWHVGSARPLETVTELPRSVGRLAARYWPGPLTLVVRSSAPGLEAVSDSGWTGMRLPAHDATRAVLAELPFPVVATSANRSGAPPLCDADAVAAEFGPHVALVVDGGVTRLREASAVLRLGRGRFELLREGLLTLDELRRTAGLAIGFACTGNTCRSPMAEALARGALEERLGARDLAGFGFSVVSMGVMASSGAPASAHAVEAVAARGLDLGGHASRPAVPEALAELDVVYGLTRAHVEALRALLPPRRAGIVELLDPEGEDVPDPIGGSAAVYRHCADHLAELVARRAETWV